MLFKCDECVKKSNRHHDKMIVPTQNVDSFACLLNYKVVISDKVSTISATKEEFSESCRRDTDI